jgi:hypothetical protein
VMSRQQCRLVRPVGRRIQDGCLRRGAAAEEAEEATAPASLMSWGRARSCPPWLRAHQTSPAPASKLSLGRRRSRAVFSSPHEHAIGDRSGPRTDDLPQRRRPWKALEVVLADVAEAKRRHRSHQLSRHIGDGNLAPFHGPHARGSWYSPKSASASTSPRVVRSAVEPSISATRSSPAPRLPESQPPSAPLHAVPGAPGLVTTARACATSSSPPRRCPSRRSRRWAPSGRRRRPPASRAP